MKDRFGAKNARTWLMRFHTQTAGVSLPAQQPMNNIARVALQALAAVLGERSLSIPTPTTKPSHCQRKKQRASRYARSRSSRTSRAWRRPWIRWVDRTFVEKLTLDMEQGAFDYFGKLDQMGGMVKAIERGYPQKEIAEASYQYQRAAEAREKVIVGVNDFAIEEESPHILYIGESVARQQAAKLVHCARAVPTRTFSARSMAEKGRGPGTKGGR